MENLENIANTAPANDLSLVRRVYNHSRNYIDYKMGTIGAALMGGIAAYINHNAGPLLATTAALKQAAYTFLFGGTVMKLCENIATKVKNDAAAFTLAVLIPTGATVAATYGVHSLKGTPEPFKSTIPTAIMAPPACLYWAHRKRKQMGLYSEERTP